VRTPYVPAGHPPAKRDDNEEDQEKPGNLEHLETEVEDPVQEHGREETGEDDP
jgi:hypothetical protein